MAIHYKTKHIQIGKKVKAAAACIAIIGVFAIVQSSCQKGEPEKLPGLATVFFNLNVNPEGVNVMLQVDNGPEIAISGLTRVEMLAGERHFVVSESGNTIVDTTVNIPAAIRGDYLLFRPSAAYPASLIGIGGLGLDTVANPREDFIKISIANYSKQLQKEIDVVFLLDTYIGEEEKQIEAGSVQNVPISGFSGYHEILLGKNSNGGTTSRYTIQIKDAATKEILQSDSVQVDGSQYVYDPNGNDDEKRSVFIAYLTDTDGTCNTQDCRLATLNNLTAK